MVTISCRFRFQNCTQGQLIGERQYLVSLANAAQSVVNFKMVSGALTYIVQIDDLAHI